LHHETLRSVGPFDVGFWPIYFEDTDYERRMMLEGVTMSVVDVRESYTDKGHARSWREGWVDVDYERQAAYYRAKWNGDPGEETYLFPFGIDPGID
jgi:GT2 family glycosyltransferase